MLQDRFEKEMPSDLGAVFVLFLLIAAAMLAVIMLIGDIWKSIV